MADRIKGITIEIGGDTTGLNKALSGVNSEIRNTQSQLKDVERLLKLDPSNTELLKQKQKLLADAVGETKDKLETLKEAEKQAQQQFKEGKISEQQYDALKREIIATQQQLDTLKDKADGANVAMQKIGQAGEKVKDFGGKLTTAGQELSKVSAGLTAVGTAAVAAWGTVDEAYDTIAKGTGATGEALEGLQDSFDKVFSSIPTDAATAGSAIADINTRFGFTGEAVEECTRKFIQFGEVNNTDVSGAIANVSRYMGDAGIESSKYSEVLDQLTAASQGSGLSVDKLSESLTKYGAPMRALGFETQESIAIFAGWEKAGVNTEIAFSGMKKAIGTWGKEGKDARKEFKKTLDEIEKCPDIASATSKAIEVFGQKAGPDLADAIQGGRFAYEDFLEIVENSEGQLEQTFNDTLDPIDDVKVAIQGLTSQGAELGGALLETLAPMITKLIDKVKELTTWFKGLDDSQKELVIKVGLLVAAMGPMLIVVGQVTTGIGGLMSMVSGVGTALTALSASGGPLFLTALAITGVASAFIIAKDNANSYEKKAWELSDAEKENAEKIYDTRDAYDELSQRRKDAVADIDTQTQYESDLWKELQGVTDENGKVKEGYEDRAGFIVSTLKDALGIEIEYTDGIIKGYQNLQGEIDKLIEKQRAEATLSAYHEEYSTAIKSRNEAQERLTEAVGYSKAATDDYNEALAKEKGLQEECKRVQEESLKDGTNDALRQQYYDLQDQLIAAGDATSGFKGRMEENNLALAVAREEVEKYNSLIANYEGASASIISGDQEKISYSLMLLQNDFKTMETSTAESLQVQKDTITQKLAETKQAIADGSANYSDDYVANLEKLKNEADVQLALLTIVAGDSASDAAQAVRDKASESQSAGADWGGGLAAGITSAAETVADAAVDVANDVVEATRAAWDSHSPSRVAKDIGTDYPAGLAEGIAEGTSQVIEAVTQVTEAATTTLETQLQQSNTAAQTYQSGMTTSWVTWASTLAATITTALTNIGIGTTTQLSTLKMSFALETDAIGLDWDAKWTSIENKHKTTMTGIKTLTDTVLKAIKLLNKTETAQIKTDSITTMNQMVAGIDAELKKLEPTVREGYGPAVKYITDLIPQAYTWATDMMDGYIQGIRDKIGELEDACEDVADTVSDYMHFTRPEKGPLRNYEEWMPHMMQGLASGIRENRSLVTDQMKVLAADMAALQTGGQQAKQPVNLTSYNVIALDGKQVAEVVNEQLGILL